MGLRIYILCMFVCMLLNTVQSQNWSHRVLLDPDGIFVLFWNPPEDKRGDSEINFKLAVKTKGCFAFGFSPDGRLPGSDIVTGWISGGQVYFQDQHADESNQLLIDDQQNYKLIDASEDGTSVVFEFRRKLDTCDENDMVIDVSTMRVIFASSEDKPATGDQCNLQKQGSKSIVLLQGKAKNLDIDFDSLLQWDIKSPDVDISDAVTLNWCKVFKSPEISEKHHIVYIEPWIQEDHEQFVHYMMLYQCVGGLREGFEHYIEEEGGVCLIPQMPVEMVMCDLLVTIWAPGVKDFVLPKTVGIPMDPNPPKFYRFEIYYVNPQLQSGIIDHSGLRIHYTQKLREFDAGNFMVGPNILPRHFIPQGQEDYRTVGHSSPICLGSSFPESGVNFMAVFLHAHKIGRRLKLRHFRGNEELVTLWEENNFDFNYPIFRFFSKEVKMLPNDQLTVECAYDSSQRRNVTLGGMRLTDEMCLAQIYYYPRVDQFFSHSLPTYDTISNVFNTNVTNEEDVASLLSRHDWASADIDEVENAMVYSKHEIQCTLGPFQQKEVTTLVSYPSDLIPYNPESTCSAM